MACGVGASGKSRRVTRLTLLSVAWADISSARYHLSETLTLDALKSEIERLRPAEILIPDSARLPDLGSNKRPRRQPDPEPQLGQGVAAVGLDEVGDDDADNERRLQALPQGDEQVGEKHSTSKSRINLRSRRSR